MSLFQIQTHPAIRVKREVLDVEWTNERVDLDTQPLTFVLDNPMADTPCATVTVDPLTRQVEVMDGSS